MVHYGQAALCTSEQKLQGLDCREQDYAHYYNSAYPWILKVQQLTIWHDFVANRHYINNIHAWPQLYSYVLPQICGPGDTMDQKFVMAAKYLDSYTLPMHT